jgi:hypothetical protein
MKETFIWDDLSHSANWSEPEKTQPVRRRQFLQTMGLVGAGLALSPKDIFAGVPVPDSKAGQWRDTVTNFVYAVVESDRRARVISAKLSQATLYYAPEPSSFHSTFWAPYVFRIRISYEVVVCSNGFEVDRFPFYATGCPCGSLTDLNAWEIRRIINAKEIEEYGCVVVPITTRTRLEDNDHADYRRTARRYGLNPSEYKPEYKRVFKSKTQGKSYNGYEIAYKPDGDASGKTLKDVLLSSEDV